jgi:monoamine oxidase
VVKQIHNSPNGVRLTTANGTMIEAQTVCCTVPLGVLKRGLIRFEPPLPPAKAQAIERLGMVEDLRFNISVAVQVTILLCLLSSPTK